MKQTKLNCKWIVIDGSIFTDALFEFRSEHSQGKIKARKSIAFNVGDEVAERIVRLHNSEIERKNDE